MSAEGATGVDVDASQRRTVADLVAEADRVQISDAAYRAEVAEWTRPTTSAAADGVPGAALGLGSIVARLAPMYFRLVDNSAEQAVSDLRLVINAPLLLAVASPTDSLAHRVAAGQAVAHMLLVAAANQILGSFLNQPIQIPRLRALLASALETSERPQLMLRLGYAEGDPPTPRRPVREVLL